MDKIALVCAIIAGAFWVSFALTTAIAILPFGLPLLLIMGVGGYLLGRVIQERLANKEDDYYERNVDK